MIRRLNPKTDYPTVASWAARLGNILFSKEMLPSSTYLISTEDGQDAAMLSLILTNSDRCFLEYALGNPELSPEERRPLFKMLVAYLEGQAKSLGFKKIVCLAPNEPLEAYYSSLGYNTNQKALSLLVKEI